MLHTLHGPIAAMLFPTTEPLVLPFEVEIYWIQHILIVLVPLYLLTIHDGHGYLAHRPLDLFWYLKSFFLWSLWHWVIMMWIGYFTLANVGSMLCAATSDPFSGPNYRLFGIGHQSFAIAVFGTCSAILGECRRTLKAEESKKIQWGCQEWNHSMQRKKDLYTK